MRSKESRGAVRAAGESRLRWLLRPVDPVPPSARLRSAPSHPGPPPSFGAPHLVGTHTAVPGTNSAAVDLVEPGEGHPCGDDEDDSCRSLPGKDADQWERCADPRTARRMPPLHDLRSLAGTALGRALPRLDPGMPGLRMLVAAGLLAAVVTGIVAWRSRPVAEPIAPPLPAAAARDLDPGAGPGGRTHAVSGTGPGADSRTSSGTGAAAPGADAVPYAGGYVVGTGGIDASPASPARVVVYVTGKVRRPGVFVLASGARVADAIEAAGGLRKGADPGGINLARRLVDGEQIIAGSPATAGAQGAPAEPPGSPGAGVLNLNTATAEQLDALPGVGGVIAQRIVDYRNAHGGFRSVDQLKDVPGIGEAKFAEVRDKVAV